MGQAPAWGQSLSPAPAPGAAALLARGMSAGYGDGGFPLELPETAMACDSAGRGAGSDLNVYGGGRRGGRGRRPGLVLVLVLWRLLLQLVVLWWGEALLGGNVAAVGTGGAQQPPPGVA